VMKYIILAYEPTGMSDADSVHERGLAESENMRWMEYKGAMLRAGVMLSMNDLAAEYTATTVRYRSGKRHFVDGPYCQTQEQISRYYIIDVNDLDEALEWAFRCPAAVHGAVEVRPLLDRGLGLEGQAPALPKM
jgi:hypothetical protein